MSVRVSPTLAGLGTYPFVRLEQARARLRAAGVEIIDFGMGEPREETPEFIRAVLADAIKPLAPYPTAVGLPELREAIAGWASRRFGVELDPDAQVIPTLGSKEAVFGLANVFDGDVVAVPTPAYPVYERGAVFAGKQVRELPLREDRGWLPDLAGVDWSGVGVLWLNYPNNPTGARAPLEFYEAAAALAREHGFVLASDEAYSELYFAGEPPASALQVSDLSHVAVFNTLSKRSSMPGYRSGFVAGDPEIVAALKKYRPNVGVAPLEMVQRARGRGLGRRGARRRRARALPRQARRAAAGAWRPSACATRAATRRSSCGSTRARTPTRWPRAGSRRAWSSRRARSSARPGTCASRWFRRPRPAPAPPSSSGPLRDLSADRARAESFGSVAADYARLRPAPPAALVDELVALAPSRVLDVGCGTGKVAGALAARGLSVLGIEIDERMAALAPVPVELASFEDWDDRGRTFDLITFGDSWHWIDPERGWRKIARVLAPGGTVVRFWNHHEVERAAGLGVRSRASAGRAGARSPCRSSSTWRTTRGSSATRTAGRRPSAPTTGSR